MPICVITTLPEDMYVYIVIYKTDPTSFPLHFSQFWHFRKVSLGVYSSGSTEALELPIKFGARNFYRSKIRIFIVKRTGCAVSSNWVSPVCTVVSDVIKGWTNSITLYKTTSICMYTGIVQSNVCSTVELLPCWIKELSSVVSELLWYYIYGNQIFITINTDFSSIQYRCVRKFDTCTSVGGQSKS